MLTAAPVRYEISTGITRPGGRRITHHTWTERLRPDQVDDAASKQIRLYHVGAGEPTRHILDPSTVEYRATDPDGLILWVTFDDTSVYLYS